MTNFIAPSVVATLRSFNEFIDEIKAPEVQQVEGLSLRGWEDQLSRLRVWAANIGAHHTNESSLDYRLRDASHIRNRIVGLLESLLRRLDDARDVLAESVAGNQEVISDSDDDDEGQLNLKPEIEQMLDSAASIIGNLFQMSMLVRKPAKHDLTVGSRWSEVEHYAQFDCNHVRAKYPKAEEFLVTRLAKGITQRRLYLKYRERHALKLKHGLSAILSEIDTNMEDDQIESMTEPLSDTVVTVPQSQNIDFDYEASDSGFSQSSYAASLISGNNITIPPLPKAAQDNEPFECPFCYIIIKIDTTRSWSKHVFQDLQPYMCIDGECMTPEKLYTSKHEWIYHMEKCHAEVAEGESANQDPSMTDNGKGCPLCTASSLEQGYLSGHIARHLEELALFALPLREGDLQNETTEERRGQAAELPASHVFNEDSDDKHIDTGSDEPSIERRYKYFQGDEDPTETPDSARDTIGINRSLSQNTEGANILKDPIDPALGLIGDSKVAVTYEGWDFVKASPPGASEKPTWALVARTKNPLSQDELRREVDKILSRSLGGSASTQYSHPYMDGYKRKQVDRLIGDKIREEMDPRFTYVLAALEVYQEKIEKHRRTTSMHVILKRILRTEVEELHASRQSSTPVLEGERIDLRDSLVKARTGYARDRQQQHNHKGDLNTRKSKLKSQSLSTNDPGYDPKHDLDLDSAQAQHDDLSARKSGSDLPIRSAEPQPLPQHLFQSYPRQSLDIGYVETRFGRKKVPVRLPKPPNKSFRSPEYSLGSSVWVESSQKRMVVAGHLKCSDEAEWLYRLDDKDSGECLENVKESDLKAFN